MAFNSINRQFKTVNDFTAYLAILPAPTWGVIASCGHNTYRPTEAQWRGLVSMKSMQATYVAKGWTAGPCLYVALGAPNPAHDGIFVMTPPTSEGIHGVTCNPTHFGVELVGDFQNNPPSAAQQTLFLDAIAALHRWAKLGPLFNMHRDCVKRTCPGDAFYALKAQLQVGLVARLRTPSTDPWHAWGAIDRPDLIAQKFAIPQLWLKNRATLGQCLRGERYDIPGVSRTMFQGGEVRFFKASDAAPGVVELLKYPAMLPSADKLFVEVE